MAQRYASAIQQQQPHGPFVLGGWSFGGAVACATAHQLLARGQEVSLVVLLDVYPLNTPNAFAPLSDVHLLRTFLDDLAAQSGKPTLGECPEGVHAYSTIDLLVHSTRGWRCPRQRCRPNSSAFTLAILPGQIGWPPIPTYPLLCLPPNPRVVHERSAGARLAAPDGGWRSVANGKWSQQIVPVVRSRCSYRQTLPSSPPGSRTVSTRAHSRHHEREVQGPHLISVTGSGRCCLLGVRMGRAKRPRSVPYIDAYRRH